MAAKRKKQSHIESYFKCDDNAQSASPRQDASGKKQVTIKPVDHRLPVVPSVPPSLTLAATSDATGFRQATQATTVDIDTADDASIEEINNISFIVAKKADLAIKLTPSQQQIYTKIVNDKTDSYVGGAAGAGKTTLFRKVIADMRAAARQEILSAANAADRAQKSIPYMRAYQLKRPSILVVCAEWGPAAEMCSHGQSVHSLLGISVGEEHKALVKDGELTEFGTTLVNRVTFNPMKYPRVLLIEEVSKLSSSMLNFITTLYGLVESGLQNRACFRFEKGHVSSRRPQIVLIGDEYQIPVIVEDKTTQEREMFFNSSIMGHVLSASAGFYLNSSLRHPYKPYYDFLQRVKVGAETAEDNAFIQSRIITVDDIRASMGTHVCGTNKTMDGINARFALKLTEKTKTKRHTFVRSVTFSQGMPSDEERRESPASRAAALAEYKMKYESRHRRSKSVMLCPGIFVRTAVPIVISPATESRPKVVLPTTTTGYVTSVVTEPLGGVIGVMFRRISKLSKQEVTVLLTGQPLTPTPDDVLIVPTSLTGADVTTGISYCDVFMPLEHAYAVSMQRVQGLDFREGYYIIHGYEAWMQQQKYVVLSRFVVCSESDLDRLCIIGTFNRAKPVPHYINEFHSKLNQLY
jgi:hypothetical protein